MKQNSLIKKLSIKAIVGILAIAWLLITIVPFIFMLLAGFKQQFEMLMEVYLIYQKVYI